MGLFVSKTDASTGTVKGLSSDDDRSKTTARTEASSTYARNSQSSATPRNLTALHHAMQHSQGWRGGSLSVPSQNPRRSQSSESLDTSNGTSSLMVRRDSDPGARKKNNSRSLPVKCTPMRQNLSGWNNHESTEPSDDENVDYLVRLYDTRTWEMYLRIMEFRKNSPQVACEEDNSPMNGATLTPSLLVAKVGETTSEWEHLQHECSDTTDGGHSMVFLFDFD